MTSSNSSSTVRNIIVVVIVLLLVVVATLAIRSYRASSAESQAVASTTDESPALPADTGAETAAAAPDVQVDVEMTCSNLGELPGFKRRHRVSRIAGELEMIEGRAGDARYEKWSGPYPAGAGEVDVAGEYIEGPGGLKKSNFKFWIKDGNLVGYGTRGKRDCQIVETAPKA